MAKINLLPWREVHRAEKKKEFLTLLGVVLILGLVVAFGWHWLVQGQVQQQENRNQTLKTELAKLDKQVKEIDQLTERRKKLLDRIEVIQEIQGNRPGIVEIFDEFARAVPSGLFFTKMERQGERISLVGFAKSNNRVSVLMRQLDASYKFTDPNLTKVEASDELGQNSSQFEMQINIAKPNELVESTLANGGGP